MQTPVEGTRRRGGMLFARAAKNELTLVKRAARSQEMTLSEFVRLAVLAAARAVLGKEGVSV